MTMEDRWIQEIRSFIFPISGKIQCSHPSSFFERKKKEKEKVDANM
jgi:hypothetical protein